MPSISWITAFARLNLRCAWMVVIRVSQHPISQTESRQSTLTGAQLLSGIVGNNWPKITNSCSIPALKSKQMGELQERRLLGWKALLRPLPVATLVFVILITTMIVTTRNRDLRGNWSASKDGKTYLVIDNVDGYLGRQIIVDEAPWLSPIGQAGRIEPGTHWIGCCGWEIGFDIRPGVVYRFTYWGP